MIHHSPAWRIFRFPSALLVRTRQLQLSVSTMPAGAMGINEVPMAIVFEVNCGVVNYLF
jgi:hypothetical protein